MKILLWKNLVAFIGISSMFTPTSAFDDLQSQQEYLKSVNSEAMRIKSYLIPVKPATSETGQNGGRNVEEMLLKLKQLTTHGRH